MTDEEALTEFLNYISSVKSYSENTLSGYQSDIEEFLSFLHKERMAPSLLKIRASIPRNYVSYLSNQGLKTSTIHRKLSSLNSFYNYFYKQEQIKENYFKGIEAPKMEKRLPKILLALRRKIISN